MIAFEADPEGSLVEIIGDSSEIIPAPIEVVKDCLNGAYSHNAMLMARVLSYVGTEPTPKDIPVQVVQSTFNPPA